MRELHARLAVVLVVEHHDGEIPGGIGADRGERAEPHEHLAVSGDHDHAAPGLRARQAEPRHGGAPHRGPQIEVQRRVAGRGHVVGRAAEPGDDEGIAAIAEEPRGDGPTVERGALGHFSNRLAPMTRWAISTATARYDWKASIAAARTVSATASGLSAR